MDDVKTMMSLLGLFKRGLRPEKHDVIIGENNIGSLVIKVSVPEKLDLTGDEMTGIYDPDSFLKTAKIIFEKYYEDVREHYQGFAREKYHDDTIVVNGFKLYGKVRHGEVWDDFHSAMELKTQKMISHEVLDKFESMNFDSDIMRAYAQKRSNKFIKRENEE